MPQRNIIALQDNEKWNSYLQEAFNDTLSTPLVANSFEEGLRLIRQRRPDVVFINPRFINPQMSAALQTNRTSNPHFRVFSLGNGSLASYRFDGGFTDQPPSLHHFQKYLTDRVPLPDPLRILLIDDDPKIKDLFEDYFERRTQPAFEVEVVEDINLAGQRFDQFSPHVLVLDLRWPEGAGREFYRGLRSRSVTTPTLILTDLVSPDEVIELRRLGNPAIIEKNSQAASMPALSALIKKLSYFG